jgi:hypothetical protein
LDFLFAGVVSWSGCDERSEENPDFAKAIGETEKPTVR